MKDIFACILCRTLGHDLSQCPLVCAICHSQEHRTRECPRVRPVSDNDNASAFKPSTPRMCEICGKAHATSECPSVERAAKRRIRG
jgi:hypothetical protein